MADALTSVARAAGMRGFRPTGFAFGPRIDVPTLREQALAKLRLNDSSFVYQPENSEGLGYIPAGEKAFVARGSWYALEDCTVRLVMPHLHLLGKSVKITMTPPKGKTETVIDIPEWDFNWQEVYILKTPLKVPAGTRFEVEAVFDNSAANPPVDVRFGEQTTDEMLFGFLGATKDNPKGGLPFVITQGPFRLR